jgi:hypothetical protein
MTADDSAHQHTKRGRGLMKKNVSISMTRTKEQTYRKEVQQVWYVSRVKGILELKHSNPTNVL